jgi:hypothetical protein
MVLASALLSLWRPYRIFVTQQFLRLDHGRILIGMKYSPLNTPSYLAYDESTGIDAYPRDAEIIGLSGSRGAMAIPVTRLSWHLVLNEEAGGEPVVVTLCTFSDAALAYSAIHRGRRLHFRPSGLARNNLLMQDRETGSIWQQFTGRALSGPLQGSELDRVPVERVSLSSWRRQYPKGCLLAPAKNRKDTSVPHDMCPVMHGFATDPFLLQPPQSDAPRLPRKQMVTGRLYPLGRSVATPRGEEASLPDLPPFLQVRCYWFAWSEFYPESIVQRRDDTCNRP